MSHNREQKKLERVWAEIDLQALVFNFNQIKKVVGKHTKVLSVVKADAYGHGAVAIAKTLQRCGTDYLGVATVSEALELRKDNITIPILLFSPCFPDEFSALLRHRIIPTIADEKSARQLNGYLKKVKKQLPVHIKIDTGMGRLGVWHEQALAFIQTVWQLDSLILDGIYTHFPSAEEDPVFTNAQVRSFKTLLQNVEKHHIIIPFAHAANSIGVMSYKNAYLNLVRPGLMLYGLYSNVSSKRFLTLRPVLNFKTRVMYVKKVHAGRSLSYGRTYVAKKDMKVATISVGYADGYNRLLSNRGSVLLRGKRCPIVGRVCMDQTLVDVTNMPVRVGDEAVLIGRQKKARISAEEIADLCHTISYEVACWISKRVPRVGRKLITVPSGLNRSRKKQKQAG